LIPWFKNFTKKPKSSKPHYLNKKPLDSLAIIIE
jgi:hypothetical protein